MSKEEKDSYLHDVFKEVDDLLEKDGIGIIWDYDPLNIYMTISFKEDDILEYKISISDIEFEDVGSDAEFICKNVRKDLV